MTLSKRNNIFILSLACMVCVLNYGLYVLDGSKIEIDQYNKESLPILLSVLIAGPLAIGLSSYQIIGKRFPLNQGKRVAVKSGLFSVLLSYLYLGLLMVLILPIVALFLGVGEKGAILLLSLLAGFGAMIVAFMVSAWIAIPIAVGLAILLSVTPEKQAEENRPSLVRLALFVVLIFIAALWVSYESIPFGARSPDNLLNEWTFACGAVSAISATFCWYFYMDSEESKAQGALAGLMTALLSVFLVGPAIGIYVEIQKGGFSFDEFVKSSMGAAIFSFFAVIFAAWKAVPVSVIIGFLVAKRSDAERVACGSPVKLFRYWYGFDK